MSKQILVNASHYETRVATLEDGEIRQLHIEREEDKNVVGNIYLGLVKRVLPGMQAAFLELGLERTAFLYVDDIIDNPFGPDVDFLDEDEEGGDDEGDSEDGEEGEEEGKDGRPERGPRGPKARQQKGGGRGRFKRRRERGSANIQDLIKEGQEILVQVAKAPIGTKGARLTTHISLPGRNLVLMPTVKHLGISRRIEDDRERRRLRDMFTKRIRPRDVGFIRDSHSCESFHNLFGHFRETLDRLIS